MTSEEQDYRTLNIQISEELYFKLLELKAQLKCKTWPEFLERIGDQLPDISKEV